MHRELSIAFSDDDRADDGGDGDRSIIDALAHRLLRHRSPIVKRCADAHHAARARFYAIPRCEACGVFGAVPPILAGFAFCAECWDVSRDAVDDPYRDTGGGD